MSKQSGSLMGFLRSLWCFCGCACDGPGGSERIRGSVLSNKGAVVRINSTGTGILIHRALVLTTHGSLPSATAAEDSEILVSRMGSADSREYRRRLAPERFFITNSVLDLTVVACDPTEVEAVQPLCLQSSVAPCLDFGRVVYVLGKQLTEEQEKDLMVGDGKITVGTDTLIKFSTDGVIWSPGSAGFDIHGNFSFMICDPMKLVSAPQRKRASATTFWKKDLPKQFGIPVPVIRHWLNQNWKGNIEELDKPRIPARLKSHQKDRSPESSSSSVKLKWVHKESGQCVESDNSEKLKAISKQIVDDEEVSSTPAGPENEILDTLGTSSREIQVEKNSKLTRPLLPGDLNSGRSRLPEGKSEIANGLTNHEGKRDPKKESWEFSTPVPQREESLNKERFFGADQGGSGKEDEHPEENGITIPWKEQDAEGPSIMVHLKGPQKEDKQDSQKVVCRESKPSHQSEIQKVSLPASEIQIENEKHKHYDSTVLKMVSRESSPAKHRIIHKKNQQLLDRTFSKLINEETIPVQTTEIQKGKHQLSEIDFFPKHERDKEKKIIPSQFKDPMPNIHLKLSNLEQKKQGKGNTSIIQDMLKTAHNQALDLSHEHTRNYKSSTFPPFKEPPIPIICIRPKHVEEKKQIEGKPTWQKHNAECSESNFSAENDQGGECLGELTEVRKPISTTVHLELKHIEEENETEEDLSSKYGLTEAMGNAEISRDYQVAEVEAKGGCSDKVSMEDFGVEMSHIKSLIQASTQRETDSSDVETMYSAETRESRNYSPRESNGKKNIPQGRRTQSYFTTVRGVQNWNCGERNSSPGGLKSAYHMQKNQVHPSCSRKISVKMPSYRGPDYFGPTVSSIMKKRNLEPVHNNKGTFAQNSPRWIF